MSTKAPNERSEAATNLIMLELLSRAQLLHDSLRHVKVWKRGNKHAPTSGRVGTDLNKSTLPGDDMHIGLV